MRPLPGQPTVGGVDSGLDGKVALVTGGSKGIGKGIASQLVDAGASVMIVSRKAEGLEEAAAEIGPACRWRAANVGDPDAVAQVVDATRSELGPVDILVNNAAANPYAGPMIDVDVGRWDKTIQVNVTAPLMWTQHLWRDSMAERGGVVINVASVAALGPSRMLGVYGLTKAALVYQTKQLAAELAPAVRVNAVLPGLIKTDFARVLWEGERGEQVAEQYPMKRLGETTDIAQAVSYLCSDAASWITGQTLVLDGGGSIRFGDG